MGGKRKFKQYLLMEKKVRWVGNHEDNGRLYDRFVRRLPELLSPGGTAVLYTMEYKLLKGCLDRTRGLTLRERKRTEAGGLLPWIFVVDRDDGR